MITFCMPTSGGYAFYHEKVHNKRRKIMAIAMAQQKGNLVYIYDENNRMIRTFSGELHGYTSSTVTVKKGHILCMYDENGHMKGSRSCS